MGAEGVGHLGGLWSLGSKLMHARGKKISGVLVRVISRFFINPSKIDPKMVNNF